VVIDSSGVLALLFRVMFPILGTPRGIIPLPLRGLPTAPLPGPPLKPPCCHKGVAYPSGALSLRARLDFFGTVRFDRTGPDPGEETDDMSDIASPPLTPLTPTPTLTPLSSRRCRFALPRPEGASWVPSSNRSIEIDPGEDGSGVEDVLSPR
jgi:hypothetical protein